MSTSDSAQDSGWQVWQPESLLESYEPAVVEPVQASVSGDPFSDPLFQAELARLRQQAEQEGYAAGERIGLEKGQTEGYQQGYSEGRQAGLEQGMAEASTQQQALVNRFTLLVDDFQDALDSLDRVIPARLLQLSLNVVRTMLGKQIACDTTILLEKIQQLLQENFRFTNNIELWVSSDDFSLVKEQLGDVLERRNWVLRADEKMVAGGCRISSEEGELDATLSANWQMLCNLSREDYCS